MSLWMGMYGPHCCTAEIVSLSWYGTSPVVRPRFGCRPGVVVLLLLWYSVALVLGSLGFLTTVPLFQNWPRLAVAAGLVLRPSVTGGLHPYVSGYGVIRATFSILLRVSVCQHHPPMLTHASREYIRLPSLPDSHCSFSLSSSGEVSGRVGLPCPPCTPNGHFHPPFDLSGSHDRARIVFVVTADISHTRCMAVNTPMCSDLHPLRMFPNCCCCDPGYPGCLLSHT